MRNRVEQEQLTNEISYLLKVYLTVVEVQIPILYRTDHERMVEG